MRRLVNLWRRWREGPEWEEEEGAWEVVPVEEVARAVKEFYDKLFKLLSEDEEFREAFFAVMILAAVYPALAQLAREHGKEEELPGIVLQALQAALAKKRERQKEGNSTAVT